MKRPITIKELTKSHMLTLEQQILAYYSGNDSLMLGAQAFMFAELIAKYFNNGETENYWWGWYEKGSGFFSSFALSCDYATAVSSRLLFNKKEDFLYATKTFPEVYKTLMEG